MPSVMRFLGKNKKGEKASSSAQQNPDTNENLKSSPQTAPPQIPFLLPTKRSTSNQEVKFDGVTNTGLSDTHVPAACSSPTPHNGDVPLGGLGGDHCLLTVVGPQGSETTLSIPSISDSVLAQLVPDVNQLNLDALRVRFRDSMRLIHGMRQAVLDYSRMGYQYLENEREVSRQLQAQLQSLQLLAAPQDVSQSRYRSNENRIVDESQSRDKRNKNKIVDEDENASKFEELREEEVGNDITPTLAARAPSKTNQASGSSILEQAIEFQDDVKLLRLKSDPHIDDMDPTSDFSAKIQQREEDLESQKVDNVAFLPFVVGNTVQRLYLLTGQNAASEEGNDGIKTAGDEHEKKDEKALITPSTRENIEILWEWLNDDNVGTIGIQGETGMGKTWTARQLMDRASAANLFDVFIWVYGGLKYNETLMQIADQLKLDFKTEADHVEDSELTKGISMALEEKHFLLILDDISLYELQDLGVPHPKEQNKSSKVVLVTDGTKTNITVDKVRNMEKLSKDEAFVLFQKIISLGLPEIDSPDARELAEPLVENCEGVPFEIVLLAGTLRNDLASESSSVLRSQQVLANLQKAYDLKIISSTEMSHVQFICEMLPDKDMRDCFLYTCICPKYYRFSVKGLINFWMKSGFLDGFSCWEEAYEKGYNILRELIDRCIFFNSTFSKKDNDVMISVQTQLVNEAVEYVTNKEFDIDFLDRCTLGGGVGSNREKARQCPNLQDGKNLDASTTLLLHGNDGCVPQSLPELFFEHWPNLEEVSLLNVGIRSLPTSLSKLNNLHVLVIRRCASLENVDHISGLHNLRVLSLSRANSLKELPDDFFRNMSWLESLDFSNTQLKWLPSSFFRLTKIRFLILRGCSYLERLSSMKKFYQLFLLDLCGASALRELPETPNSLRMLDLSGTLVDRLPFVFNLSDLEYLILRNSLIDTVPHPYAFPQLKVLDLSGARSFREFESETSGTESSLIKLDLSETQILEVPSLSGCVKLREILLRSCPNLKILPALGGEIEVIDLSGTVSVEKFETQARGDGLLKFDFSRTRIGSLPLYLMEAANIVQLLLRECEYLEELPHLEFQKLQVLDLSGSINFKKFNDDSLGGLLRLETLNLSATQVMRLPVLSECRHLQRILLRRCLKLETLPKLEKLTKLKVLDLTGATSFKKFQDVSFGIKKDFQELDLSETQIVEIPNISECHNLCKILLKGCSKLEMLPHLEALTSLQVLDLSGGVSFRTFQDQSFGKKHDLKILDLSETKIVELPSLSGCINLCKLILRNCPDFKTLPRITALTQLEVLDLSGDISFSKFQDESLENNCFLKQLDLSGTKITEFSFLSGCKSLCQLSLRGCSNMEKLSFEGMLNLQKLDLSKSPIEMLSKSISELHLEVLTKLKVLDLSCTSREFPYGISKWRHLRFLGVLDRKFLWGFDLGNTGEIIEQLNWHSLQEGFGMACMHITVSNTEVFLFMEKNLERWEACFQKFHFCLCSSEEWGNEKDIYLQEKKYVFRDNYYQTWHIPQLTEEPDRFFKICGFQTFPDNIWRVLSHVELLYLKKNGFVTRLSDLGADNVKVMRECWIERCDRMDAIFYGEEIKENFVLGRCLENLWVSYLSELKCLFQGVVPSGSFTCLKHIYVDCCTSLISIFSSHVELIKLEKLEIKFCDELENICGGMEVEHNTLPKLKTLILWKLPKLKSICEGVLPSLENLRVKGCSELKKLPVISSSRIKIKGELVWWNNLDRENQGTTSHLQFTQL